MTDLANAAIAGVLTGLVYGLSALFLQECTVKDGAIEIQGDQREKIAQILSDAGFRPVFAGG